MTYTVIIGTRAKRDIRRAAKWLAKYSPKKAARWHQGIEDAIFTLENNPFRCPLAVENEFFPIEIRQLLYEKYRVLYTVLDQEVHVLYVVHGARVFLKPED